MLLGCGLTSAGLRLLGEVTSLGALVTFFLLSPLLVGLTLPPLFPPLWELVTPAAPPAMVS